MNMKTLRFCKCFVHVCLLEETPGVKASITRGPTPQDSSHIAFGSKVIRPPPLTTRKSSTSANRKEERTKSELSLNILSRRTENVQPRPPFERPFAEKMDEEGGKISLDPEGPELLGKIAFSSLQTLGSDLSVEDKLTDPVLRGVITMCCSHEVFTFSSCPHSARKNQASSNPVEDFTFGLKGHKLVTEGERKDARLEDDFVGSESKEFLQRCADHSITAPPPPSAQKYTVLHKFSSEPIKTQASTVQHVSEGPKRQGSGLDQSEARRVLPDGDTRISSNRASVREISLKNSGLQKVSVDERVQTLGSSRCDLRRNQDEDDEEDELQMLGGPGLSASQVHHCNISLSASSDDTSTWTQCIPLPVDQGQHYQKEINPLLHYGKGDHSKVSPRGSTLHNISGDEEFLNLMYDLCLSCYFDPQSGKYYELL
uniref:Zgc:162324 n=1 Tax=Cyprinus carpio TaxID=7962 RepID=A0A8C2L6L5_CYPCA